MDSQGPRSQSTEWYSKGQSRVVEFNGASVTVRWVDRNGRRCRIAITAPLGATFRSVERKVTDADEAPSLVN
jgi:outer membrane biogenesis lipoprotein LolB